MKKEKTMKIFGLIFTLLGVYWAVFQDLTNGLLLMILGELVDLPYRIKNASKEK